MLQIFLETLVQISGFLAVFVFPIAAGLVCLIKFATKKLMVKDMPEEAPTTELPEHTDIPDPPWADKASELKDQLLLKVDGNPGLGVSKEEIEDKALPIAEPPTPPPETASKGKQTLEDLIEDSLTQKNLDIKLALPKGKLKILGKEWKIEKASLELKTKASIPTAPTSERDEPLEEDTPLGYEDTKDEAEEMVEVEGLKIPLRTKEEKKALEEGVES